MIIGYYMDCDTALCPDCFNDLPPSRTNTYDPTFPLAIDYTTERDSPVHCEGCEGLIPVRLTTEGYRYVRERVAKNDGRPEILEMWRNEYATGGTVFDG